MNRTRTSPASFRTLTLAALAAAALAVSACTKDAPAVDAAPAGTRPAPAASQPPAGTDADNKRIAALELATKIDAELATLERGEKQLADGRAVDAWMTRGTPAMPKKIVVTSTADGGTQVTDLYYDDKGLLAFARAPDGLFIFQMESLSVWLDRDQKTKRGVNPGVVKTRVDALTGDSRAALALFSLR